MKAVPCAQVLLTGQIRQVCSEAYLISREGARSMLIAVVERRPQLASGTGEMKTRHRDHPGSTANQLQATQ